MRRRGLSKPKRIGILLLLLLLSATFLVSCIAGSGELSFGGLFAKDGTTYLNEPMLTELSAQDATVAQMLETLEILVMSNVTLPTFEKPSDVIPLYRDAILNDLLRDHYTLYTGNQQTLSVGDAIYPNAVLTTAIPVADFESAVKSHFGMTSVRHKSGTVYTYLERANVYTTVLEPWESNVSVQVTGVELTAHTYRLFVTLTDSDGTQAAYCATFIKRDQDMPYLQALKQI